MEAMVWVETAVRASPSASQARVLFTVRVAAEQVRRLQEHGVEDFHFYTLNRADLTYALCHILGMRPAAPARAAKRSTSAVSATLRSAEAAGDSITSRTPTAAARW